MSDTAPETIWVGEWMNAAMGGAGHTPADSLVLDGWATTHQREGYSAYCHVSVVERLEARVGELTRKPEGEIGGAVWSALMDACKANRIPPATQNAAFSVINRVREMEARVGELEEEIERRASVMNTTDPWQKLYKLGLERDAALARITALDAELQDAQTTEINLLTKIGLYAQQVERMERERDIDRHANAVLRDRIIALEAERDRMQSASESAAKGRREFRRLYRRQKEVADRYGLALMMVREGCAEPSRVAGDALSRAKDHPPQSDNNAESLT